MPPDTPDAPDTLDDYLRRFERSRRITLVGPLLAEAADLPDSAAAEAPLVWVDGGANHRRGRLGGGGADAGFSVGDGDSSRAPLDQYLRTDKEYSDLAFVLQRLPARFVEVTLLGFLGARRDHELFNLGEVHRFLASAKTPTEVRFDRSVNAYSKGEWIFEAHAVFSLAVFAPTTVKLTGACRYPLATPTKLAPLVSLGLSNHGFGGITLTTRGPAFIFQSAYNNAPRA